MSAVDCVHFNSALILQDLPAGLWLLRYPFMATVFAPDGSYEVIEVPEGYRTDLATVPRLPFLFALFGDKARKAALIHDWLYDQQRDRAWADDVFLAAMRHDEPWWRRSLMWAAVRVFGGTRYPSRPAATPQGDL